MKPKPRKLRIKNGSWKIPHATHDHIELNCNAAIRELVFATHHSSEDEVLEAAAALEEAVRLVSSAASQLAKLR